MLGDINIKKMAAKSKEDFGEFAAFMGVGLADSPILRRKIEIYTEREKAEWQFKQHFPIEVQKVWKKGKVYKDPFTGELTWFYEFKRDKNTKLFGGRANKRTRI